MRFTLALIFVLCLLAAFVDVDASKEKGGKSKGGGSKDKGKGKSGDKDKNKSKGKESGDGVERFNRCQKLTGLVQKSSAGQSFYSTAADGYVIRSCSFSSATTSSGFTDTIFMIAYKKVTLQKQVAVKRRITKFVKSTEISSIATASQQESICGILSDFDNAANTRYFAFVYCECSNAAQNEADTRTETKTISLKSLSAIRSLSISQVIKSLKITSFTSESVTVEVTYTSYHYEREARFTESTTIEEFRSGSSSSSFSSSSSSSSKTGIFSKKSSSDSSSSSVRRGLLHRKSEEKSQSQSQSQSSNSDSRTLSQKKSSKEQSSNSETHRGLFQKKTSKEQASSSSSSSQSQSQSETHRGLFQKNTKDESSNSEVRRGLFQKKEEQSSQSSQSQSQSQSGQSQSQGGSSGHRRGLLKKSSKEQSSQSQTLSSETERRGKLFNRNRSRSKSESSSSSSKNSQSSNNSSSNSAASSTSTTITEQRISSFKKVEEGQRTEAFKSFRSSCAQDSAISEITTTIEKNSNGQWDTVYQFSSSKVTSSSQKQTAVKTRITKFVKAADLSSVKCSGRESLAGVLSDYDEKNGRTYALECRDYSNTKVEKVEKLVKSVSLTHGSSQDFQSTSSSNQVIQSIRIASMSSTTIAYEITYVTYSYSEQASFSQSSSTEEYKSQSKP